MTSLRDLELQQNQMLYPQMQQLQSEQNHTAAHTIQQGQHIPYYNIPENNNYPSHHQYQSELANIPSGNILTHHHDHEVDKMNMEQNRENKDDISEESEELLDYDDSIFEDMNEEKKYFSIIPEGVMEAIIIFIIYLILSNKNVRDIFTIYIPQLAPNAVTHSVDFVGVLFYGILLSVLYYVSKILFMK